MSNELTVYKALSTAGQAAVSIVEYIKNHKAIRKQDAVLLQEQLNFLKHEFRANAYGKLARISLDEIQKTLDSINQMGFSTEMQAVAADFLQLQIQALRKNLQNY